MDPSRFDNTAVIPHRSRTARKIKLVLKWALAGIFVVSGAFHFWRLGFDREFDLSQLPWPYVMVYLSGGLELMLGIMLIFRTMQVIAAWSLIMLLIAVTPAHIYFAVNSDWDLDAETIIAWGRLGLQAVLITWTFWYTRTGRKKKILPAADPEPDVG